MLIPEPSNPVDPEAVAVMVGVQGGRGLYRLGYIPREAAPVVTILRGLPSLHLVDGTTRGARLVLGV